MFRYSARGPSAICSQSTDELQHKFSVLRPPYPLGAFFFLSDSQISQRFIVRCSRELGARCHSTNYSACSGLVWPLSCTLRGCGDYERPLVLLIPGLGAPGGLDGGGGPLVGPRLSRDAFATG